MSWISATMASCVVMEVRPSNSIGRPQIECLRALEEKLHEGAPAGKEILKAVGALPATMKSLSEILTALSDPETQQALRRAEQLLRLLPQSSPQAGSNE